MRLIDADTLKEEVNKKNVVGRFNILLLIDNAPTVVDDNFSLGYQFGVRQTLNARPQGEWIDYDNTFYKCPDCGYLLEKCCPQCQNKVILPKGGVE